jgi:hypothetical protein
LISETIHPKVRTRRFKRERMGRGRSRLKSRRKGKMMDVCSFRVERTIGMLDHHELS